MPGESILNDPAQIDRVLKLLADKERRQVIEYFQQNGTDTQMLEVLSASLARAAVKADRSGDPSTDVIRSRLHHVHLPKLEEYGVVEYDHRTGDVRYRRDERIEAILEFLSEM